MGASAVAPMLESTKVVLKRRLDEHGLVAAAYDARARLRYLTDRETRSRNEAFRRSHAYDGLPLPPPALVYAVAGHFDLEEYYESGRLHAELIRELLARHGFEPERFRTLLDFGCGCGRVIRHWRALGGTQLHGSDYNARLLEWCRAALPFAEFRGNRLVPPLPYERGMFDFVYAVSVFTHLTEPLQGAWIRELRRVLVPGGLLLLTTKGRSRLAALGDDERRRFERGELVVLASRYAGRNLCAAFHPERYLRGRLADGLRVVDFVPAAEGGAHSQDLVLLQKPAEPR